MPEHVRLSPVTNDVVTLTLDRPEKKNALSIALRDEVTTALGALAADPQVKVVVLTGVGDVFSAGFDLGEFQQASADAELGRRLWESSDRFHAACLGFPLPLVAAVNGPAIAGGFDLAVMCDIRIAARTATFSHPEITFGDVVYAPLHDLVGAAVARELCLTGRVVGADEALRLRLVSSVVPPGDLAAEAARLAAQIARAPREALLRTKAKIVRRAAIATGATLDL
jgi:enoyl-CoA hydratase